jgi:hypothetical protein
MMGTPWSSVCMQVLRVVAARWGRLFRGPWRGSRRAPVAARGRPVTTVADTLAAVDGLPLPPTATPCLPRPGNRYQRWLIARILSRPSGCWMPRKTRVHLPAGRRRARMDHCSPDRRLRRTSTAINKANTLTGSTLIISDLLSAVRARTGLLFCHVRCRPVRQCTEAATSSAALSESALLIRRRLGCVGSYQRRLGRSA